MIQKKQLAIAIAATFVTVGVAYAQTPQKVEKVEITGSNIKRIDSEGPLPVIVIKREDIEASGKTTVNELLSNLTVVSGGSFSEATNAGNTFAPGTASVSLRGLGVNTTLVLLNGRRIANYGFAQNINENFVDLNSIPVSAIERIEILKDGASAIYGSDAIAGVINVILRKDFSGVEVSASTGFSKAGGGAETRAAVTAGFGSLAVNRFNAMVTLDYYKRDAINSSQRDFVRADQRGFGAGGSDFRSPTGNPGYFGGGGPNRAFSTCPADRVVSAASLGVGGGGTVCAYDFTAFNNLIPETQRVGAMGSAVFQLSPNWSLFAEGMFNRNETDRSSAPTPASFGGISGHPDFPAGQAFNSISYRFLEAGGRLNDTKTDSARVLGGIRGSAFGWDMEAAVNYARSKTTDVGSGFIIQNRAAEAFAGTLAGFVGQRYRVINPSLNPAGMLAAISISPVRVGVSDLKGADVRANRELFSMAGGPAAIAIGYEYRKEEVADTPDFRVALINPNRVTVSGSGGTAVAGGRTSNSGYAELSLPFAKNFESQIAIRSDNYSDFGTATTPKVGLSWKPTSSFLARAGYAEGFRAPSLAELFLGESTSFPSVRDTPRCNDYRNGPLGPSSPDTQAVCGATNTGNAAQVRSIFLGNTLLGPEKSKSYSAGIVLEPSRDTSVALDYYRIDHKNRILSPTAGFILANESLFPGAVTRAARTATDVAANARGALRGTSGDLTPGITRTFFNASQQNTSGLDLDIRNRFSLGDWGRLDLTNSFTYIIGLKRQLNPGQPLDELVNTYSVPRWRHTISAAWTSGSWGATINGNTIAGYQDNFSVNGVVPQIGNDFTVDAQVRYTGLKGMTLALGASNLFDHKPPFSNENYYGYNPNVSSPRGAYYYASVRYKF